ncbi:STY4851/ECs_5259 family protein [Vibrio breoganii]
MATFRQVIFSVWSSRGLKAPDGSPLYSYKLSDDEFTSLQKSLIDSLKSKNLSGYVPSSMSSDWAGAFVLYASEWWRKEFSGGIWSWDPIFESLGLTGQEITAGQRNRLIAGGFRFWRRPILTNAQGNMYLGTVAVEGGLPLKLVSNPDNKLAHYFEQVIQDFGKYSLSKPNSVEIARAHDHNIAASFRNDTVYTIVGKISEALVELAERYGLDEQKDPVRYLDAVAPNWLDTLPINIDQKIARGLLERALGKAITIQRRLPNTIRLVRSLNKVFDHHAYNRDDSAESQYQWALRSELTLRPRVNAEYIQQLFAMHSMPDRFSLFAVGKKPLLIAKAFLPQNRKERFLVDIIDTVLPDDWFNEEVQLMAKDDQGNTWFAPLVGGSELDIHEPWVFTDKDNSYQLQGSGDVTLEERSALVILDATAQLPLESDILGEIARSSLVVVSLNSVGQHTFGSYCVELGGVGSQKIEYVWSGEALPYQTSPAKCFVGKPELVCLTSEGHKTRVSDAQLRWHDKSKQQWMPLATMPYGQTETAYVVNGKPKKRFRLSALPEDFDIEIKPGSNIHKGDIVISSSRLPVVAVSSEHSATIHSQASPSSNAITLELFCPEQPPAFITIELWWVDRARSISMVVPFPSRGVCLLESQDQFVDAHSDLLIDRLNSYELYGFGLEGEIELMFVLQASDIRGKFANSAFFSSVLPSIDALASGLALASYRDNIQALFALSEKLDAKVKFSVLHHGTELFTCNLAAYTDSLLPNREEATIEFGTETSSHQSVELLTVPLDKPDQTPLELVEISDSASSSLRVWKMPDEELQPGAWLVFNKDLSQGIRPVMWSKDLELLPEAQNGFEEASGYGKRWDRLSAFSKVASDIAYDFTRKEWKYVRTLLAFDAVPLTTFDLWRGAIKQNEFVFAMLLNANKNEIDRVWQIDRQFPFVWYALSISDAVKVCSAYHQNLLDKLGDDMADVAQTRLFKKLRELVSYFPGFAPLSDLLLSKFDDKQNKPSLAPAAYSQHIFDLRNELSQRQVDSQWPKFSAEGILASVIHKVNPEWKKVCFTDKHSFKNTIMNAPVLLALSTCGQAQLRMNPEIVHALREYRRFDEIYFDQAFALTQKMIIGLINA